MEITESLTYGGVYNLDVKLTLTEETFGQFCPPCVVPNLKTIRKTLLLVTIFSLEGLFSLYKGSLLLSLILGKGTSKLHYGKTKSIIQTFQCSYLISGTSYLI